MINNPATWFVNNQDIKEYTYKGGKYLYHFSPADNNLSNIRDFNIIFFADNEKHGLDILKDLFSYGLHCKIKQLMYKHPEINTCLKGEIKMHKMAMYKYLKAIESNKIKLSKAPTNQVYKVSWSNNDTL